MNEYAVEVYLQFVSGNDPDSYYPGEDKLWLEILLDAYEDGRFLDTIDCNGIQLPLTFLHLSEKSRKKAIKAMEDEIAEHVAEMLVRNNVEEYCFDGGFDFSWVAVANSSAIRFGDPDFDRKLDRVRRWS